MSNYDPADRNTEYFNVETLEASSLGDLKDNGTQMKDWRPMPPEDSGGGGGVPGILGILIGIMCLIPPLWPLLAFIIIVWWLIDNLSSVGYVDYEE
ncbi:MAG: hypothetical protein AAF702_01475 [Chloroflexota bacterium]